jgi:hypothetical protein
MMLITRIIVQLILILLYPLEQFSKFRSIILPQITLSKHNYNRMSCEENTKRLHVQNGGQQ